MADAVFVIDGPERARAAYQYIAGHWMDAKRSGRPLVITVEQEHRQRSHAQNKRLHAMLQQMSEQVYVNGQRYAMETWKEWYRRRYIGTEEIELPGGHRVERGISTTTQSVEEAQRAMEQLAADVLQEFDVELLSP